MARLRKRELLDRVIAAIEDAGRVVLVEQASHPFMLRVQDGDVFARCRVYIWNITHGGGQARPTEEYRIQITGASSFIVDGTARTSVLGWWEEGEVFCAWDVSKHSGTLGASPSFQVLESTLRAAAVNQFATQEKGNDEIAIAFVPQFLPEYLVLQPELHDLGATEGDVEALARVAEHPAEASAALATASTEPRRVVLAEVARKLRDRSFGERVLRAYGYACAMCGVQLKLVEAAHIVPVASANHDGTDNGIALCTLHHRAFDRALLSIDEKYRVVVNPDRLARLKDEDRAAGYSKFRRHLRALLALPPAKADRPDPQLVIEGNRIRGWKRLERVA